MARKAIRKNLFEHEVTCKCGCGFKTISAELADRFQLTRDMLKEAIHVTSGNRCVKHNTAIKGSANSSHMKGMALDLTISNPTKTRLFKFAHCLSLAGFRRMEIHVSARFIHVDVDHAKGDHYKIIW